MSLNEVELCLELVVELYGEIVGKVAEFLMKKGASPLKLILSGTGLKLDQVKKCLQCLIQQNICSHNVHRRGFLQYVISIPLILQRVAFPRYIYSAKTLYSEPGELLTEEFLRYGNLKMSDSIRRVTERLIPLRPDVSETKVAEEVVSTFTCMAQTHFIQQVVTKPNQEDENKNPYFVPDVRIQDLKMETGTKRKRRISSDDEEDGQMAKRPRLSLLVHTTRKEEDYHWRINHERFEDHLRDQAIAAAVERKIDRRAALIIGTVLRLSELHRSPDNSVTHQLSSTEIFHEVSRDLGLTREVLDQYLSVLSEDSAHFLQRVGDSGGGMYVVNFKKILSSLCCSHIESVVQERFGSKSLRIFRLLILKRHLEQKQIEEFAMIPAKEAKELLYRMFEEKIVSITEIPKTPDYAPSRTFYLFSVNLVSVADMLLQRSYRAVVRLMHRRHEETNENRRLLERQQRVEAIAAQLEQSGADEEQRQEIEDMITPPEREQLNKVKAITDKLDYSELNMASTIFTFKLFLKYANMKL